MEDMRKKRAAVIVSTLKRLYPTIMPSLNSSNTFEFLVAVILSAQCTDARVNIVTKDLFQKYRTVQDYVNASIEEFEQDVRSTGFYKNKAKNIKVAAQKILSDFGGKVPGTMDELLKLPGVARKTANVVLGNAYGVVDGIAVDTHVKRLSKLLGLTNYTDPEKIERDLMEIIPKKDWFLATYLLINYGRHYCPARPHDHAKCPLTRILK